MAFHEVRFPTDIARRASGGPERRTDVVVLGSGHEERNARWADSRRRWDAGYGVKSLDDLHAVIAFFEERRGRLHGFRFKDHTDWKSCPPGGTPQPTDQTIGTGDGVRDDFPLTKTYGAAHLPWTRRIAKPVAGSVIVAVDGAAQADGIAFVADPTSGIVTFLPGHVPAAGATVTAGYAFDVPVRFDTDRLRIDLEGFGAGTMPDIPLVEIRI